jgi:hypothetical protein
MLCSIFDISIGYASQLLPELQTMCAGTEQTEQSATTGGNIRESTAMFFTFTRKVGVLIAPHTISYFMQLIAIGE